jgi:hypothetical protein
MEKIMAFLSRQRFSRARPGSGLGRNAKKIARPALGVYSIAAGKAKLKIPAWLIGTTVVITILL